jgi:hypothetical protein
LLSFSLIKKSSKEHWLVRVSHHIISDAESWTIFFQELALIYEAKRMSRQPSLPDQEPLQYADHAVWQRQVMRPGMPAYMESLAWWKERLARLPPRLDLPFKRTTPILSLDPAEGVIKWGLDPEIARGLDELRRQLGATYYMSRLAVLAALIAAETGQPDMVLGTYASNRNRVAVQNMFGFFSNPLSLRLHCDPEGTFRDWLIKVRDVVAATAPHCEIPFEELRRQFEAQTMEVPDLTVFFTVSLQPISERFADLELKWLELPGKAMPWGFTFDCAEHNEEDACRVKFDAGLYDPEGVREFIARFGRLAAAVSRQPDLPLRELMDLSAILWRNPASYSPDSRVESVHE